MNADLRSKIFVLRLVVLIPILLVCVQCFGQAELEETFETSSEVEESPELFETLEELRAHPLDINRATEEELAKIPWITLPMAKNLIEYRKEKGLFGYPSELVKVKGFSAVVVDRILPYVIAEKPGPPITRRYELRDRVAGEHPEETGYVGSSERVYNRAIVEVGETFSSAVLAEKDPYEEDLLDLFSFHVQVKNTGPFTSTVLGDYSLDFGEGLVFSPSRFVIKGSGITKSSERGVVPSRSTTESGVLRGGATTLRLGSVSVYGFVSKSKLDASINEEGLATSIDEDGLHRSANEIEKIDKLDETLFGARGRLSIGGLKLGVTGCSAKYDPPLADRMTSYYTYSGESYHVVGADLGFGIGSAEFFGEFAHSISLGQGYLFGFSYRDKGVDLGMLYRHYDEDFYSPHSAGFSDSDDKNEEGAYLEMSYKAGKRTKVSGYMDIFKKLGPSYGSVYSSQGRDVRIEVEHKPDKRLKLKARTYMKGKDQSSEGEEVLFKDRRGFRIQGDFRASKKATLTARFETVAAVLKEEETTETGSLLYWEVVLKPVDVLTFRTRLSVFDVESWDARLYQYESDLPGVMKNVAVSGTGAMGYGLLSYRPVGWLKLSGKLSWMRKDGESELNFGAQSDIVFKRPMK